jgi:hypothetical protein
LTRQGRNEDFRLDSCDRYVSFDRVQKWQDALLREENIAIEFGSFVPRN